MQKSNNVKYKNESLVQIRAASADELYRRLRLSATQATDRAEGIFDGLEEQVRCQLQGKMCFIPRGYFPVVMFGLSRVSYFVCFMYSSHTRRYQICVLKPISVG